MSGPEETKMILGQEGGHWRVIRFPDRYERADLMRKTKEELVTLILELNNNGVLLEKGYLEKGETVEKLKGALAEEKETRQVAIERAALLQEGAVQLIRVMAQGIDE